MFKIGMPKGLNKRILLLLVPLLDVAIWNVIAFAVVGAWEIRTEGMAVHKMVAYNALSYGIGALFEELFFRGYMLYLCVDSFNMKEDAACILNSLVFGLLHFTNMYNGASFSEALIQVVCAMSAGWCFAVITCRFESVWIAVVIHVITNVTSALLIKGDVQSNVYGLWLIVMMVVPVCLAVFNVVYTGLVIKRRQE